MPNRLVSVGDDFKLPPAVQVDDANLPDRLGEGELSATFVVFRNHDGTPVAAPKVVAITLTVDGADIDNIAVYDSIAEVGS